MMKNAPLQDRFASKVQPVYFGGQPIFASNNLHQPLDVRKSAFGHLAFGANQPSFESASAAYTKALELDNFLFVRKEILSVSSDAPAILSAVGLGKINYSPKCYGKKMNDAPFTMKPSITMSNGHSDVTLDKCDLELIMHSDHAFGKLN